MICLSLVSLFFSYARKGAKKLFKPINVMIVTGLIAGSLYSTELPAQVPGDTTWATGILKVKNPQTNSNIPNYLDIQIIPLNVQMTDPDTIKDHMAGSGLYAYKLAIHSTVGLNPASQSLESRVFPTIGSELNVFLEKNVSQGTIEIYDMTGKRIKQQTFSGDNTYISFPNIANGVYFYAVRTDEGISTGKFLKQGSEINGPSSRPNNSNNKSFSSNPNARTTTISADYIIKLVDPNKGPGVGYEPSIDTINIVEGINPTSIIFMTPVAPLTVDLSVNVWELFGDSLENAFFYIKDSQGTIDSARTDSTGNLVFEDLAQGSSFTAGVGGVANYKNWDGFTINIPNNITTYQDTIFEKNYVIIPDTVLSGKINVMVYISASDIDDIHNLMNIQASLDTSRYNISSGFSSTEQNNLSNWLDNISSWTGIPIIKSNTPFVQPQNYNAYTTAQDSVGTNIIPGPNNTYSIDHTLQNGDIVRMRADPLLVSGNNENAFYHEFYRSQGRGIVTSWTGSVMNPTGGTITDKDIALFRTLHQIGIEIYKNKTHDLPTMNYLTDTSAIIP